MLSAIHLCNPRADATVVVSMPTPNICELLPYAGLKASGVLGICWQTVSLTVAVTPVWLTQLGARLPASTTSHVLLAGLVASRFGLWLFDLSVSQMLQEWVPPEDIGMRENIACCERVCLV